MEQQINEFIDYLKKVKSTSENTSLSYKRDLIRMADYMKKRGVEDVGEITQDQVLDYCASLREEQFAASSITRHNTSIKAFFRYMLENGNIRENPAENIKSPKVGKKEARVLSIVEVENLLTQDFEDSPKGMRDRAILELMYATGLKTSEVIQLKLSNVDMALGCLRLKGRSKPDMERVIPYGKKAKDAMRKYLLEGREKILDGNNDDETVFLNCNGRAMSRQGLWKLIKTYVSRAGIKTDITPFTLRHSFAAHLVENGADSSAIQELMGYCTGNSLSRYISDKRKISDPYDWARIRN